MAGRRCPHCGARVGWREILEEGTLGLTCRECRTPLETDRTLRVVALLVGALLAALVLRLWGSSPVRQFLGAILGFFVGSGVASLILASIRSRGGDQGLV